MSRKFAHFGLHLTVFGPVVLGALGALLYSSVLGSPAAPLGESRPGPSACLGDRLVEAWPAPAARTTTDADIPEVPSPVASDL